LRAVEEFFLHLWDEWDDLTGICRHLATEMAAETLAASAPLIAAVSGTLLAGISALLLVRASLSPLLG
jgi:uncharacterized membrane-anchored protein YitT (DUF2179 family)